MSDNVLRSKKFSFGSADRFYCKHLIRSPRNHVQIAYAQLVQLIFPYN